MESSCGSGDSRDVFTPSGEIRVILSVLETHLCNMGHRSTPGVCRGPEAGHRDEGCRGRRWLCASMEDNLVTVKGGSGCLKELSIPAALLRREVKAICPTSMSKDTHTFRPSVPSPVNRWRRFTVPKLNTKTPTYSTVVFLSIYIKTHG